MYKRQVLLVSHDRELIRTSCNRCWLIHQGGFSEWHDIEAAYASLRDSPETSRQSPSCAVIEAVIADDNDALLERLITLETQLAQDIARKTAHQKPALQAQWREEIERINALLM